MYGYTTKTVIFTEAEKRKIMHTIGLDEVTTNLLHAHHFSGLKSKEDSLSLSSDFSRIDLFLMYGSIVPFDPIKNEIVPYCES